MAGDLAWQENASCAKDPNMSLDDFYFDNGVYPKNSGPYITAKLKVQKICGACPVRVECLLFAIANGEKNGFWGGLSKTERRMFAKQHGLKFGEEPT